MFSCVSHASVCDATCPACPRRKARDLRYVFLDIDGVLNSRTYLRNAGEPLYADKHDPTDLEIGFNQMSPELVQRLNGLVVDGVAFVLSSTWRRFYKVSLVQEMLHIRGFRGILIGATPALDERPRGQEIASWIESETGVELARGQRAWPTFVILDDNDDMDRLRGRLVQTDYDTGLQDEHIERALQMLRIDTQLRLLP